MALVKFRDCLNSELDNMTTINGSFIITRDAGELWCDTLAGERLLLNNKIHVVSGAISSYIYPETGHFYYSSSDSRICFYDGTAYRPVNISVGYQEYKNIRVPAAGNTSVTISSGYTGTILGVSCIKKDTDISLYDLDATQFVGGGYVTTSAAVNSNGTWTIPIANTNPNYAWLGSITVMIIQTTVY